MIVETLLTVMISASGEMESHLAELLEGVEEIATPRGALPGPLVLTSEGAFAFAAGQTGANLWEPAAAAVLAGKGRAAAFGHGAYLNRAGGRALLNAVRWTSNGRKGQIAVVQRSGGRNAPPLAQYLNENGFETAHARRVSQLTGLSRYAALCVDAHDLDADEAESIQAYLEAGGGLVTAGLVWGWLQLNPGKTVHEHPGNRLLGKYGLFWGDGYLRKAEIQPNMERLNALLALDALNGEGFSSGETRQASWLIARAMRAVPPGDVAFNSKVDALIGVEQTLPRPDAPLKPSQPKDILALTRDMIQLEQMPPQRIKPHPAAKFFPGAVPADAPKAPPTTISVRLSRHGWRSTGLYAAPGALIEVETPQEAVDIGLKVRIGAHTDKLWNKSEWRRAPQIATAEAIQSKTTYAANAFGGLIYIDVPRNQHEKTIQAVVKGAVRAPYYVHGETDLDEWRDTIRHYHGPWAELEAEQIILTVPSSAVRDLDSPDETMRFWSRVMDACVDLASEPEPRKRPERIVPDTQISAGYMHAGYPIMTHLDVAERSLDPAQLMKGSWGHYHELGHNFQSPNWTFNGTVEVTCNLFTLYVYEKVCGIPLHEARDSMTEQAILNAARLHAEEGAPFDTWKKEPFLALAMYAQMVDEFGWDAFKEVFAGYDAPIRDDNARRDEWMKRFSRNVGRNLGPFFEAWGVPTSDEARESLRDLPVWLPAPFQESAARRSD